MTSRLGMVTVGQSPRSDIVPAMTAMIGPGVAVVEKGALDGLSDDSIQSLAPTGGQTVLCTRLVGGEEVVISKQGVIPLVQKRIKELNREGVDLILLLCTGHFPSFESRVLVLTAQAIVDHAIQAVIGDAGTLGLVVPLAEQAAEMRQKLRHITSNVVAVSASPYAGDEGLNKAAEQLDQHAPDLVVLYCIGFNQTHRRIFRQVTGKPVIVANSLLSRTVAELLEP
ncbi:MAG: AroM family protein [Desulfobacterales bacterium]